MHQLGGGQRIRQKVKKLLHPVMGVKRQKTRRRRRVKQRRRQRGGAFLSLLKNAAKLGFKLGEDKSYKRMGAIGAKGHYRANPRPWAV